MSITFALKCGIREFLRNLKSIDVIEPPYGTMFNSRVSGKTSRVLSSIIEELDNSILIDIKEFDTQRRSHFPEAMGADWIDLINIIGLLKITSPRKILELGSGVSTAAFVSIQSKVDYNSEFLSLDDSHQWGELTEKLIKQIYFNTGKCDYKQVISPSKIFSVNNKKTVGYEHYPKGHWDFIYIDGPPIPDSTLGIKKANCCLDPIRLNSIREDTIILIDGRNANVKYLSESLKVCKNSKWKRYKFAYPSDDTLFLNLDNKNYSEIISFFSGSLNSSSL
tara:strand:+ start:429 stop:1265 length:837 start_codon:yes stop_codon:yes gene_type:complete